MDAEIDGGVALAAEGDWEARPVPEFTTAIDARGEKAEGQAEKKSKDGTHGGTPPQEPMRERAGLPDACRNSSARGSWQDDSGSGSRQRPVNHEMSLGGRRAFVN